jgi:hypothetical protein
VNLIGQAPLLIAAGALIAAVIASWLALAKRADGDCGDYWASVVKFTVYLLGLPMLASTLAESVPAVWNSGYHLHFERVRPGAAPFWLALLAPAAVWLLILAWQLMVKPEPRERCNWIAGSAGYVTHRRWVLLCLIPFLQVLIWLGPRSLGGSSDSYPAGSYTTLIVFAVSLVGVALSTPAAHPRAIEDLSGKTEKGSTAALLAWPEAMKAQGIVLERMAVHEASAADASVQRPTGLALRLRSMGARGISGRLAQALEAVLMPEAGRMGKRGNLLLFAPDDAGQVESIALAAWELARGFDLSTLVITPRKDENLGKRFTRWLPGRTGGERSVPIRILQGNPEELGPAGLWLVDAETLSDFLMPRLAEPQVATRIGLVVWCDVHQYSGVLAANLWAISRRLDRILKARGRSDLRTIVLVREAFQSGVQMSSFVRRLLPYDYREEEIVHVERTFARRLELFRVKGHADFLKQSASRSLPERCRHLPLVSTLASASSGWSTSFDASREIPADEINELLSQRIPGGGTILRDQLVPSSSESGASIRHLDESEILSLPEILCQGGRASDAGESHYVGITHSANPYLEYLIGRLTQGQSLQAARRLLGAEGHELIFRRHLLLALSELEDTHSGLLETIIREKEVIDKTLQDLSAQNELDMKEVRFLNARGELVEEHLYRGRHERQQRRHPLTAAGESLAEIVASPEAEGTVWRVDAERLPIEAYPGRVFLANGVRYRVRDWVGAAPQKVECQRENIHSATWRIHTSWFSRLAAAGEPKAVVSSKFSTRKVAASVKYHERVEGVLRREYNLSTGSFVDHSPDWFQPKTTAFDTTGLVIYWNPPPDSRVILALCQALRHVLPIHLGVEEEAVEVVPVEGPMVEGEAAFGLAIVDLYPHGIGLAEAVRDDEYWIRDLLSYTRDWLAAESAQGRNAFQSSPLARATGDNENPRDALDFLKDLLDTRQLAVKANV